MVGVAEHSLDTGEPLVDVLVCHRSGPCERIAVLEALPSRRKAQVARAWPRHRKIFALLLQRKSIDTDVQKKIRGFGQ
jgi:hypothetical protein